MKNNWYIFKFASSILIAIFLFYSFLQNNHVYKNLEPYPDGLFYTVTAKNFFENFDLSFRYNDEVIKYSQPPLYPIILSFGYFINDSIFSFYLINIILFIASYYLFLKILESNLNDELLRIYFAVFYISHFYFLYITALPLTENLGIFLTILSASYLIKNNYSKLDFMSTNIIALLIIMTKISMIPMSITIFLLSFYKIRKMLNKYEIGATVFLITSILFCLNILFYNYTGFAFSHYFIYFLKNQFTSTDSLFYFSFFNMPVNFLYYMKTLLGFKQNFLWLNYTLTTFPILLGLVYSITKDKNYKKFNFISLILVIISQFSILFSFYAKDNRYIITSIPLFLIIIVLGFKDTKLNYKDKLSWIMFIGIIIQIFSQIYLIKQIISENVLGRSQAWQYESAKTIEGFVNSLEDIENSYIVTSLPPHYVVNTTNNNNLKLLPLSHHQEFMQKGQYIWGDDINYDNLLKDYEQKIKDGLDIYITNAYITHQHEVVKDFEAYKERFELVLVKEGCLQACNIYALKIQK